MIEPAGQALFRILGPIEVRVGQDWVGVGAPKWRAILALLLLQAGQPVSADALIAGLWEDAPPARAGNLVSVYVHRLRRLIGDAEGAVLVTRSPGYLAAVTPQDLDAGRFARMVAGGRRALAEGDAARASGLLSGALAQWRGRALADVPPSPLVTAEADRLEEARVAALSLRIEADLGCGRAAEVTPELRRLLADHPLREELWALLLRALHDAGRQAEALEEYARARNVIADELGVDPGPRLRQIYHDILRGDAVSPAVVAERETAPGDAGSGGGAGHPGVVRQGPGVISAQAAPDAGRVRAAPGQVSAGQQAGSRPSSAVPGGVVPGGVGPGGAVPGGGVPGGGVPGGVGRGGWEPVARPSPGPPVPAQLPADLADFTGRDGHVTQILRLLSGTGGQGNPGALPVALVVGSGGLGKTTLAVHAAHLLAAAYPDGQLYAGLLGATDPADPDEVLARFLRDLGADPARIPAGLEERAAQYRSRLAGRRVLIVLDDARDAAQVRPLLPGSGTCAVLITARGRLPEMVGSRTIDLEVLPPEEARALFAAIAGEERASAEPAATQDVLAACAGLPLAIRIAGARLAARGGWNVHYLAGRLSDERRRLDELRTGNLAVRASFEVSFASLAAPASPGGVAPARAFRMLGVWPGTTIGLRAAAALLGEPEDAVEEALEAVVDAHLLDSPEPDQYRFHDLLRVYAADRARAQESEQDRHEAIVRVLNWYLHTAEAAARAISRQRTQVPLGPLPPRVEPLGFASLEEALDWCEAERAGLVAATRLAAATGLEEIGWKLPAAAMSFLYRRSHAADWVSTHRMGLECARVAGDKLGEAWMLQNLGMAYGWQRQSQAVGCFEQSLVIYRDLGDAQGQARAANNVAKACLDLGRFEEAREAAGRSLGIQRRAGNRYGAGLALGILGCSCRELRSYQAAVDHFGQSLEIFRELGDQHAEADALGDLGGTYLDMGRTDEALGCLRESLAIWRATGNPYGEASTLRWLGQAWLRAGDPGQGAGFLAQALRLFTELGDDVKAGEVRADMAGYGRQAG